jgi:DNA-binding transcriptional MerR regulator
MEEKSETLIKKDAAALLAGVSTRTIRRWAVAGLITERRDPANGWPWYIREEIEAVRNGHEVSG